MDDLLSQYQANVSMFPAMLDQFAEDLGLDSQSFADLGLGYIPDEAAWVCPERDTTGKVVGLSRRFEDGKKFMVEGGKRGYIYAINPSYAAVKYDSSKYHWVRCTGENPCPICDKPDWCMVSSDNPSDPGAVLCARIEDGSRKAVGDAGYLHILKKQSVTENYSLLAASDDPVIVTEGMTDWAAATQLGFVAVGRPNATFTHGDLGKLLAGRKVIVVGDNDISGVGAVGVDKTVRKLESSVQTITSIFPPDGIKDLREWVSTGLTKESFLAAVGERGKVSQYDILLSPYPLELAAAWLRARHNLDETLSLRYYGGKWYHYTETGYEHWPIELLRGDIYDYLGNKNYMKLTDKGEFIEPLNPTKAMVSNVVDALNKWCPLTDVPPIWLAPRLAHLDPNWLMVFRNGILDVKEFLETGCKTLIPPTPDLFTITGVAYDYDPAAQCLDTDACVWDILSKDRESWDLWWEWAGYNKVLSHMFEKLMMVVGPRRSGKGTLLLLLTALVGHKNCASTSFQSLGADFAYQPLEGKSAAILADAQTTKYIDTGAAMEKIKTITGGDPVGVNLKGTAALSYVELQCRFTIFVNDLPTLPDNAQALEARLNLLSLKQCYVGREDRTMKKKIVSELPGAMNRALAGLARLMKKMNFTEPQTSWQMKNEFCLMSTPIATFLEECCEVGDTMCTKTELFGCWKVWCEHNGMRPGTVMSLQQRLISYNVSIWSDKAEVNGGMYAVYRGLKLNKHGEKLIGE